MELIEYYQIIKKHWRIFFLIWLMVIGLFLVFGWLSGRKYQSIFSISIKKSFSEKGDDYQYDQYYRLLAEEKFSEKVLAWFEDPETVRLVFDQVGIQKEGLTDWKSLMKVFQTKKISVGYSQVHFQGFTPKEAEKIVEVWRKILTDKINQKNQSEQFNSDFSFFLGQPLTNLPTVNYLQLGLVGVLVGWPLALFGVLFVDYFRKKDAYRH